MQISHRYKFIFFSFPKTGSESVRELLAPYSDIQGIPYWKLTNEHPFYSHISPPELKMIFDQYGWEFDKYYKFTFIRNPWARMASLYNMIYKEYAETGYIKRMMGRLRGVPSFKEWLRQTSPSGNGAGGPLDQRWQVYGAYSIENYILDKNGEELVDQVVRLEDIKEKLPGLLKLLGLPHDNVAIPYINKGRQNEYADYYDEELRDLIYMRYRYDIERFGYRFEDIV